MKRTEESLQASCNRLWELSGFEVFEFAKPRSRGPVRCPSCGFVVTDCPKCDAELPAGHLRGTVPTGWPDTMLIYGKKESLLLFIEYKLPGETLTQEQQEIRNALWTAGFPHYTIRHEEEVPAILKHLDLEVRFSLGKENPAS